MRARLVLLLAVALVVGSLLGGCAGAGGIPPRAGALKGDEAKLQGAWIVAREENNGVASLARFGQICIFHGREFQIAGDPTKRFFRVDDVSNPRRIDFDDGHSPAVHGLYEMQGTQLSVRTAPAGQARPARLSSKRGTLLTVLVRQHVE